MVPEVYWTWIMSPGATCGSTRPGSALARNSSQVARDTISRSPGGLGRMASAMPSMSKPR